jgi:16S rRNA G966 N2-methylase RsmD
LWLAHNRDSYDIVFYDPPFTDFDADMLESVAGVTKRVLVARQPKEQPPVTVPGFVLRRHRRYGKSVLALYTPVEDTDGTP